MAYQGVASFDSRAITLNGKRTLLLGGSLQYPKIHHTQWNNTLKLAKECGLNFLDIYVFWNVHEKKRGIFTFTEEADIFRFLQMAHQHGLLVMLRLGPYICAETSYGGFPCWLREIPGIQFRTYNDPFMREVKRWLFYITTLLKEKRLFFPQGGPIVLVQLENEYDLVSKIQLSKGEQYLNWYNELYRELAFDVPLIMCRSSPEEVGEFCSCSKEPELSTVASVETCIETFNSFYGHKKIADLRRRKPHQPILWTEFWIGWYDIWTSAPRKRSTEDVIYAALRFIAQGGAGFSYYMFHGGTHFNNLAMYSQTTSYYFDSPIDEYGRPSFLFYMLKRINHILHQFSSHLLSQDHPQVLHLLPQVVAFIWQEHSSQQSLSFLCNDSEQIAYIMFQQSMMKMNPLSVAVFLENELLFDSSSGYDWQIPFRDFKPLERAYFRELKTFQLDIPIPPLSSSCDFSQLPDMLSVTQDETDYMWYISSATLPVSSKEFTCEKVLLQIEMADLIHLFINQQYMGSSWIKIDDERFANGKNGFRFSIEFENSVYPQPVFSSNSKLCGKEQPWRKKKKDYSNSP
ncbi:Beta-galactosidase 4 [Galdieria sulphuraria]|nr:Beta-galactosidase 4 [Galdieria sulphuraria]